MPDTASMAGPERAVELGQINDEYAQITAGLAEGEMVVVNPANILQDGGQAPLNCQLQGGCPVSADRCRCRALAMGRDRWGN
jgi:hypothetical protein